ncbi:MAG: helix-turn-helix transcriptional regulator [Anoxybacillus sp.]|nr:helix-turn-helix transcriptional regulator [Anoxybacillus sp.]MCL6587805.1 helix-turn-helix transcriptional regulator [Anoxybacillus sp.]
MMSLEKEVGEKLKKLREKKGYTMRYVGEKLGMDYSYISKIEKGHLPSIKVLKEIAELYGATLSDLFGESQQVPDELKEIGVEWIFFAKEMKEKQLTPDEVRRYIEVINEFKNKI